MRQYMEGKGQVPDAIMLFRMGDFYELFFEDAEEAAPLMEVVLTSRDKGSENPIPMCGVPHHALNTYVGKLLEAGKKVAICEQVEDPALAKGIVKREVVRVVSPGVVLDIDALDSSSNNYLAAIVYGMEGIGLAYVDASTGVFRACRANDFSQLRIELARIEPRELVYPGRLTEKVEKLSSMATELAMRAADDALFEPGPSREMLADLADLTELSPELAQAAGGLVGYLRQMQRTGTLQLEPLEVYELQNYLVLDETAVSDLELFRTISGGQRRGSLLWLMDHTSTPMGARLLKRWLAYPLVDKDQIDRRLDSVGELKNDSITRSDLREVLKKLYDIERLSARVVTRQANPRELRSLATSMAEMQALRAMLGVFKCYELGEVASALCELPEPLAEALEFMREAAPSISREGGIFTPEYNEDLGELLALTKGGREWLLAYEAELRESTTISSLKIRFNKVFGYYIEVTRANLHLVPEEFIRKQTLVNAERYFTPELKEHEEKVLHAQERAHALESQLFEELLGRTAEHREVILAAAAAVARLDVYVSFAELAHQSSYCRPDLDLSDVIELKDSRHPVVEKLMGAGRFVPNDLYIDCEKEQLLIITGPNMAGKSTVMRQVALIAIMAQMGSFVPATGARIGMVDRVFTRVGATDSLARGLSTFMVEMKEAAEILKRASRRSLVILDELGRGTSTYDGLSIAWSMAEYIHDFLRTRAMFATHYHELTQLTQYKKRVRNLNIAVKEFNDEILFLHKLVDGATNRSYGVQVARLAGVPRPVIDRAKEILSSLEEGTGDIEIERPRPGRKKKGLGPEQPSLFTPAAAAGRPNPKLEELKNRVKNLSLDTMTPIEALNQLFKLKKDLDS